MAAATDWDGMDAVDTLYANTRNNPVEDIESHLPLRVTRYELRDDATPAGQWRGGVGSIREFTYPADGGFSIEGEGHKYRPWGFAGGENGVTAELRFASDAGIGKSMPSKVPYHKACAGDRLIACGPSGGGYGDPRKRSPEAVLDDLLDGYIGEEAAQALYGVVIRKGAIDQEKTDQLRKGKV